MSAPETINRIRILGPESADYPYWRVEIDGRIIHNPLPLDPYCIAFTLEEAEDYVRAWVKAQRGAA